jgi:high-affinity nickel-transport protein
LNAATSGRSCRSRRLARTRRWRALRALDASERRTIALLALAVIALHAIGFLVFATLVASARHRPAGAGSISIGIGVTAYTLGLRHAFDADHIVAIDNATRKLMSEGKRPLSVGFWFSLGHSTVVFLLALLLAFGVRSLANPVADHSSTLHQAGGVVGTLASGGFLYAIAALNLVILLGIVRVIRDMRRAVHDALALERQLESRGLLNRLFGTRTKTISSPRQMYPVGLLFGLGFDTASEVALLVLAGGAAGAGLPWYAILCLPILFAAGMSLMDTIDGSFMNFAYGWALSQPVRKVYYNLAVTGLSIAVAFVIGTVELGGLLAERAGFSGSFWAWLEGIDINMLGVVIVGMFLATWVIAICVWRFGRIEQRWGLSRD